MLLTAPPVPPPSAGLLRTGKTYLSLAAAGGLVRSARALLAHGADPNCMDANGDHPLHLASARDKLHVARLLLDAGAVPGVIDGNGETPLQLAPSEGMRKLLLAAGSSPIGGGGFGGRAERSSARESEEDDDEDAEEDDDDAAGILTSTDGNIAPGGKGGKARGGGAGSANSGEVVAANMGPPENPKHPLGDKEALPAALPKPQLISQLQVRRCSTRRARAASPSAVSECLTAALCALGSLTAQCIPLLGARSSQALLRSGETDLKKLLVVPHGLPHEVQLDVLRVGKSNAYKCFLRLGSRNERRICIFEASRTRKGSLKNSQYLIKFPKGDPRLVDAPDGALNGEALEAALYCGKVRSYNLSGANFVAYDDGIKVEPGEERPPGKRLRRQMVAMTFNKSSSRRVPMTMRMLVPAVEVADAPDEHHSARGTPSLPPAAAELLDSLQALPNEESAAPPPGTRLLKLVPPRWNAEEQMFQLFCEGRACCMSNKNVQLADTLVPEQAVLQVGKLNNNMFNVDLQGVLSPFQVRSEPPLAALSHQQPARVSTASSLPRRGQVVACPIACPLPSHRLSGAFPRCSSRPSAFSPTLLCLPSLLLQAFCSALAVFDQSSVRRRF